LAFIGAYVVLYFLTPSGKCNPLRRRLMFATWERPAEGNIHVKLEIDCTKAIAYCETFEKSDRPTVTHVVVKACAELLNHSRDTLNGKIIFDKYVPFERVAVTVLIDINNGQDLAAMTIENTEKMSIK
jgi:hypothetical protein